MASLFSRISEDLQAAMKARNEAETRALRLIKSAFLILATEKGGGEVSGEMEIRALQKMARQRKESIEIYDRESRPDLSRKEMEELEVIERYLPKAMSEVEISSFLRKLIERMGASGPIGPKDFGKVMPLAVKELAGKADGKVVSEILKKLLE